MYLRPYHLCTVTISGKLVNIASFYTKFMSSSEYYVPSGTQWYCTWRSQLFQLCSKCFHATLIPPNMIHFIFISVFLIFIFYCSIAVVPPFSPLPSPALPTHPTVYPTPLSLPMSLILIYFNGFWLAPQYLMCHSWKLNLWRQSINRAIFCAKTQGRLWTNAFLLVLGVSLSPWHSLASRYLTPISASVISLFSLCVCLCVQLSLFSVPAYHRISYALIEGLPIPLWPYLNLFPFANAVLDKVTFLVFCRH